MEMMKIGQPFGGVIQIAYTVEDIEQSMKAFTDQFGLGPWFVSGPFVPSEGIYRGQPTDMTVTLAVAYSGHMMVELIQQHDDKPSVYQEFIRKKGHGFHHWAVGARDLKAAVQSYKNKGYEVAFSDRSPRGVQIVYMDTSRDLPGMIEIIEITDALEDIYQEMYEASLDWDGTDPVRKARAVPR
ncbi:MAG TPA: VOC family protein [Xanthobacteraceae bacterium]|nr:VOC family protein [Xanthobacteraceae bacterium]